MSFEFSAGTDFSASGDDIQQERQSINVTADCAMTLPDALEDVVSTIRNSGTFTLTIKKPDTSTLFTLLGGGEVTIRTYVDSSGVPQYETFQTYTPSNVTTDRTFDANATTTDELADVVGTLIADLKAKGILT